MQIWSCHVSLPPWSHVLSSLPPSQKYPTIIVQNFHCLLIILIPINTFFENKKYCYACSKILCKQYTINLCGPSFCFCFCLTLHCWELFTLIHLIELWAMSAGQCKCWTPVMDTGPLYKYTTFYLYFLLLMDIQNFFQY